MRRGSAHHRQLRALYAFLAFGFARHAAPTWEEVPTFAQVLYLARTAHWENGYDIRTVEELLGHSDGKTKMIYRHALNRGPAGVRSPADRLPGTSPRNPPIYADPSNPPPPQSRKRPQLQEDD